MSWVYIVLYASWTTHESWRCTRASSHIRMQGEQGWGRSGSSDRQWAGWLNGLKQQGMAHFQSRTIGNPKRKEQEPRIEQRILRLWPVLACMIVIRGGDGDEAMKIQCNCGMGIKRKSHHCPAEGLSGSWSRAISKQKTRAGALEVHCTLLRLAPSGVGDWPRVRDCCRCYLTYKTWLPRRTHIPLAASTGERTSLSSVSFPAARTVDTWFVKHSVLPGFQGCKSNQRYLCMLSAISDLYNQHFFLEMSFSALSLS